MRSALLANPPTSGGNLSVINKRRSTIRREGEESEEGEEGEGARGEAGENF
jgi:hypothetical protein